MITEEHLTHWLKEIDWQLTGISKEVGKQKIDGIQTAESWFSFEYVKEKVNILEGTIRCIRDDMRSDNV